MRISTVIQNTGSDFEQRKKMLARKEMDQAYKKQAKYVDPKKNPMLHALENLLSGKTEKELLAQDVVEKQDNASKEQLPREEKLQLPEVKQEIKDLMTTEREVVAHEQAHKAVGAGVTGPISYTQEQGPDDQLYITGGEVSIQAPPTNSLDEKLQVLEKVRQAALAPANPSPQDLRVAASATAQIQAVRSELNLEEANELEEEAPFANETFEVNIPERFMNEVERDAQAETLFGKDLEKLLVNRMYNKAKSIYSSHVEMVKNNYRSYNEPLFSRTA